MYSIVIKKRAKKYIDSLPQNKRIQIVSAILQLPDGDTKKLKGHDDLFRLRVGEYRIIYSIDGSKLVIVVIDAGSRGDVYKRY